MKRLKLVIGLPVALLLFGGVSFAQPGKEKREEKREDRKEKRDEKKEELKDKRDEKKEELKDKRDEKKGDWAEKHKEWREKRQERRTEHRTKVKEKWGDLVKHPAVRAELTRHGRRMARLNRLSTLAEEHGKDDLKTRVDGLITKEQTRHQARMEKLKEKGGAE